MWKFLDNTKNEEIITSVEKPEQKELSVFCVFNVNLWFFNPFQPDLLAVDACLNSNTRLIDTLNLSKRTLSLMPDFSTHSWLLRTKDLS